jgi:hypothetical protein
VTRLTNADLAAIEADRAGDARDALAASALDVPVLLGAYRDLLAELDQPWPGELPSGAWTEGSNPP